MFATPAVAGDNVIIGSCAGTLYALQRKTGEPSWRYDARNDSAEPQFHGDPRIVDDSLIIPTDAEPTGYVYAFDTRRGDLRWKVPFPGGVAMTPLVVGKRIVVASAGGTVAAIDPANGTIQWQVSPAGPVSTRIPPAAADEEHVFYADDKGKLFALDPATGKTIWRRDLPSRINTSLIVIGKTIVAGTNDGQLVRLATDTGDVIARTKLAGLPYGALVFSRPLLFVMVKSDQANLVAFDLTKDAIRWQQSTPKEWTTYRPLLAGTTIIAGNEDKELCAFDVAGGTRLWCRDAGGIPRGLGLSNDRLLYVGTLAGRVSAYPLAVPPAR